MQMLLLFAWRAKNSWMQIIVTGTQISKCPYPHPVTINGLCSYHLMLQSPQISQTKQSQAGSLQGKKSSEESSCVGSTGHSELALSWFPAQPWDRLLHRKTRKYTIWDWNSAVLDIIYIYIFLSVPLIMIWRTAPARGISSIRPGWFIATPKSCGAHPWKSWFAPL